MKLDVRTTSSRRTRIPGILIPVNHPNAAPSPAVHPAAVAPSLDGRRFVMESSTNSEVNPASPSRFRYHERHGVIWGDYEGDTVTFGQFVGTRVGNELSVSFAHVLVGDGAVVTGTSGSVVESTDGGVRLVENFRIGDVDHVSICVEAG
jgi:hypothetical protein